MKSDTAEELNRIYHAVTSVVNDQENIDRPISSHGFDLLNHLVIELFDLKTRLEWESLSSASNNVLTYEALVDFITKRAYTQRRQTETSQGLRGPAAICKIASRQETHRITTVRPV